MSSAVPPKREMSEYRRKLSGVVDMQIHLAPDIVQRSSTESIFAKHATQAGYFGWLSKCHHLTTAGRQISDAQASTAPRFFGSVALNNSMGGLNPYAVEVALKLGASEVWMPTLDAQNHIDHFGQATLPTFKPLESEKKSPPAMPMKPIRLLNEYGELKEEAKQVIEAMRDSDAILGTGHLSLNEIHAVLSQAKENNLTKILVTHPEFRATSFSKEDQKNLSDQGAFLEHCSTTNYDPKLIAQNIKYVGASKCILSSDSGLAQKGSPLDCFYEFLLAIEAEGISTSDIQKMTIDNPRKLLGF